MKPPTPPCKWLFEQFIALLVFSYIFPMSSCVNLKKLFKSGNEVLLEAMKEELNQFQVDMTKSFMQAHSRRKRAQAGHVNDIDIKIETDFPQIAIDPVGPFSTFTFAGNPFLIKRDGIYQLNLTNAQATFENITQAKKGSWMLRKNEFVLNGFEWKHNFFLVTTTGSFSTIYTLHESSLQPVFRQNILNKANAAGAEFFDYRRNLYMVIINDNDMHSTTFSPIFRWAGSYMDEIHQIQTTGASSVKTFLINSKEYIAIAQSKDSAGNTQVGTVVLSMDHMDRLERVQLLWSDGAHKLHHMRTEKEHFLVIGQETEPSIVYWFGGMDFIFWQQFDELKGKNLVMEGLQLTSDEPILLTSTGRAQLQIFSRSASATKIMTTWIQSKTFDVSNVQSRARSSSALKITQMKLLHVGQDNSNVFLAVTRKVAGSHLESIQMYPVNKVTRELAVSQTKETSDPLLQCLQTLRTSLKDSGDALKRIDEASSMVLTKNDDVSFSGEIIAKKVVKPVSSKVESAEITPDIAGRTGGSEEEFETAPSKIMDNIKQSNVRLEVMKSQLDHIFSKANRPNVVTSSLKFLKHVQFNTVEATDNTNLKFDTINDVSWTNLDKFALRTSFSEPQEIFSQWTVNSIKADSFQTKRNGSKLSTDNFLLKSCTEPQTVSGVYQFNKELKIDKELAVEPDAEINGIQFSNIALKQNPSREIHGYKHVPLVKGKYDTAFVSGKNLQDWFANVARLSSESEQIFTGQVEIQKDAVIQVDSLMADEVNGKNWKEFGSSVMLDGADQQVTGLFNIDTLRVDNLKASSISGISSDDLLQIGKDQNVASHFTAESVEIASPLSTGSINGIQLSDAVNRNDQQVEINGPALLENFKAQDVIVPETVTIADKDVSELANLRKVHIYSTAETDGVFSLKQLSADKISTQHINHNSIDDFSTKYWSKAGDNVASPAQLVLDDRDVFVSQNNFKTGKLNHFSFPEEFVSLDGGVITLRAPLQFKQPVTMSGDVTMGEGSKIQGIDLSEAQSMIVDGNFEGIVRGVKTFESPLKAVHGAQIGVLNEMDPINDVVMRNSDELQSINSVLTFDENVDSDQFTVEDGDVHVKGKVNQVNLENVKQSTAYKNKENRIDGELVFERGLNVDKFSTILMNSLNIKDITDNMIFLDSPDMQTIVGDVFLENGGAEFLVNSLAGTINNVATFEYLSQIVRLDSTRTSVIKGTKTFLNANLNDRLMCTKFSNVDLKDLESNAFSKSKSQVISGKWSLKDSNFEENLKTDEIQGISLNNIVFTDESVEISSPVAFTSKDTKSQGPVSVAGRINGIEFDKTIKEDAFDIQGIQNFNQVIVDGDLNWSKDRHELQGLSYLFENAVTKSGKQTISGDVTFSKGFQSSEISTPETWLRNVDLQHIKADAVLRSDPDLIISGSNEFTKSLRIKNLVDPVTHLDTETVNGINLQSMNDDIVKTDDLIDGNERRILGRKKLGGNLKVENLKVMDEISGISPRDLVLTDSDSEIGQVQFRNLEIEQDIESESETGADGLDLASLLNDRISLSKPNQDLQGVYSFEQVSVESVEECKVPVINDVKVGNVLKEKDLKELTTISGKKTFKNLEIDGGLETTLLNNHNVKDLFDNTLRIDQPEKITKPVKFESPVVVNQELEVESINNFHLKDLSDHISGRIKRLEDDAESPQQLAQSLNVQASKLQQISQERPVWLDYLRLKQDLTGLGLGAHSKVDHVQVTKSGDVLVTLHRETDGQLKGLPKGCNCNSIFTVNLKEFSASQKGKDNLVKSIGEDNCLSVFNVVSPNRRSYMVISETISSNVTCVTEQDETTKIFQDKAEISNSKMGYVSDVGVFSEKEDDFLVLAQYFDKSIASHSTVTRIMRVDSTGRVENVQNIETHGAKRVVLSKVNNIWMLAIANSKSSTDESSCNADSAIYMWSRETAQFLLMRTIMTDGAFDVEFITTETSNEFYKQSFVAFAQEGNSASGEVMIFRYEQPGGNFVMSQTIRSNWPVSGLRSVCMCQKLHCFLVTTVPQEGITFYENRFVEGFQEYYKAPVFGATDISGFQLDDQQLFAIATNKGPILAEAVIAGSCPN